MNIKKYFIFFIPIVIFLLFINCDIPGSDDQNLENFFDSSPVEIKKYSPNTKYVNNENVVVHIKFSKDMNTKSVENAFTFDEDGKTVLGKFSWSGADRELTFYPDKQCEYGKKYRISITKSAEDVNGNDLKNTFTHNFIIGNDEGCPYVILGQCSPAPNSVLNENQLSVPVIIVFSEPMLKPYSYKYVKLTNRGVEMKGLYEWLNDAGNPVDQFSAIPCRRLRITPNEDYIVNEIYKVEISTEITDQYNNPLRENYVYQFIIGEDFERPVIETVTAYLNINGGIIEDILDPGNLNEQITKDAYFSILFSKSMDREDTEKAIKLNDDNIKIKYKWITTNVPDDTVQVILENNYYFEYNGIYTLNIYKDAHDTSNNKLENDYNYNFIVNHPNSYKPSLEKIYIVYAEKRDDDGNDVTDDAFNLMEVNNNGDLVSIPFLGVELIEFSDEEDYIIFGYSENIHTTPRILHFHLYFDARAEIYENSLTNSSNFVFETMDGDVSLSISKCENLSPDGSQVQDPYDPDPGDLYYGYLVKIVPESDKDITGINNNTTIKFQIKGGNNGVHDVNGNYLEETIEFLTLFDFSEIE